jgi:hypothetical protein
MSHWKERARAGGIHLGASVVVALLAAALVFSVWYPYPYRDASGGRVLFMLVVSVDVIVGPLLTFAIFNRKKPSGELKRDLAVVILLQLDALCYGLWTVYVARPAYLAFEIDRFRVVHAIEIDSALLEKAPPGLRSLPLTGPRQVAVRPFKDSKESGEATMAAVAGVSLSARPDLWENYDQARERVRQQAKPATLLTQRFPQQRERIAAAVQASGRPLDKLAYLPMSSRMQFWTVLLDSQTMEVVGFIDLDSF